MSALLSTCIVSLAAVVGLGCTAAKEGPADVGAGLFSVAQTSATDTASVFGVWEGTANVTLTSAVDRIELRASGVTYARRCKASTGDPWHVGAHVDATVTEALIELKSALHAGVTSAENVPCQVALDQGTMPRCDLLGSATGPVVGCFVHTGASLQLYVATKNTVGSLLVSFAKVSD